MIKDPDIVLVLTGSMENYSVVASKESFTE